MKHEIRDTGDDHWMTGWPRWACTCGMTGASRTIPTRCPDDFEPCSTCKGKKRVLVVGGTNMEDERCPTCNGTGKQPAITCHCPEGSAGLHQADCDSDVARRARGEL